MESLGVLLTYPYPHFPYLEQELLRRGCHLLRLYDSPKHDQLTFLRANASSIRAIISDAHVGVDAPMIDALPYLEIVASFSVGVDKIDLVKCRERGIRVTNTPDVLTDDVADLAIALAIAVLRKLPAADRFVRSSAWMKGEYTLTTKFSGKKVGILGLGRIGLAIAKHAEAFDCSISYYSRSEKAHPNYKYYKSALDLASNCEVLFVSCALNDETRHIVNSAVIDALGPQGILINIGRGPHMDEVELVSALVEGRLGGVGLDVFENEPNVPEEFFQLDNVVMTPHVGSDTMETAKAMADLVIANLEAHVMHMPLLTPLV